MFSAILLAACVPQDPDLAAVRASEARRVAVMERCAQAVCSVMDMQSPGGGSGVIIDPRGFVLTNYHVVGQSDSQKEKNKPKNPLPDLPGFDDEPEPILPEPPEPPAGTEDVEKWKDEWREEHWPKGKYHYRHKKIGLPDGELYEGVVLGIDPGSDLAIIRLIPKEPGQRWPFCDLGDSDALLVGETVFAMGNPFLLATDFTPTTTFGIVSGTHRYQEGGGNRMLVYPDCIQVDAPVNPGNSGGPLFNEAGEVVGINGRISIGDRGRVNVGVGFAISSNQIKNFLGDLIAGRHTEHGTLDMSAWYMDAPREEKKRRGVFVQQMFKDSIVAKAGVSLGDEITMFNGVKVRSANQLATLVGVMPAGAWVTLGYRPQLEEMGYGDERIVTLRLTALDTGSSADAKADTERLASRHDRRIATKSLLERFSRGKSQKCVDYTAIAPDGTKTRYRRLGDRLRIDIDDTALVRLESGECFKIERGQSGECSVEERARLDRELRANPLLWGAGDRFKQLGKTLLVGGGQILGKPAFRFEHEGDGELQTWLLLDGTPGGYVIRDPIRRAKVEWHIHSGQIRVIADREVEHGWTIEGPEFDEPAETLFARPQ